MKNWIEGNQETFYSGPPKAGAAAYGKYDLKINSTECSERLLEEKSTLVVPGDHFGMGRFIRIGCGLPQDHLIAGLNRIDELAVQLK